MRIKPFAKWQRLAEYLKAGDFVDKESNAHSTAHHNMASFTGNVDALDAGLIV